MLATYINGNWVDLGSLITALIYAFWKAHKNGVKKISKKTATDIANGASLFPLFLLGVSIFSSKLLTEVLHANKLILSVAGLCALLSMLEDDF